jgi:hypothetical protein
VQQAALVAGISRLRMTASGSAQPVNHNRDPRVLLKSFHSLTLVNKMKHFLLI